MSITLAAIYENGVFRPTEPVALPESSRVEIVVRTDVATAPPTADKTPLSALAALAKGYPDNPDLPADLAAQHDHYLYGATKTIVIYVDSGYLVALLKPRDKLFERAQRWAAAVHEPLITSEYVLWELVNSLSNPIDRPKVHAAVAEIRSSGSWELVLATPELLERGLALHQSRQDKHWSLTDCASFEVMQQRSVSRTLAYDHHFEQAGFEALLRRDPP